MALNRKNETLTDKIATFENKDIDEDEKNEIIYMILLIQKYVTYEIMTTSSYTRQVYIYDVIKKTYTEDLFNDTKEINKILYSYQYELCSKFDEIVIINDDSISIKDNIEEKIKKILSFSEEKRKLINSEISEVNRSFSLVENKIKKIK